VSDPLPVPLPSKFDRYADILIELCLETRAKIARVPAVERPALVEIAEALDAGAVFLRAREIMLK